MGGAPDPGVRHESSAAPASRRSRHRRHFLCLISSCSKKENANEVLISITSEVVTYQGNCIIDVIISTKTFNSKYNYENIRFQSNCSTKKCRKFNNNVLMVYV